MKVTFLGGSGTVTGSKYLVESDEARIFVDCGLFQGQKQLRLRNRAPLPFDPGTLDAVLLTHAHLDHSGYLPLLVKNGFRGPVHCTSATRDLCGILLPDSGHLQEEAEYANRHGCSRHRPAFPLYTRADAERCMERFDPVAPGPHMEIGRGVRFRLPQAGHLLGAAMVHLFGGGTDLLFTGDLGRPHDPLLPPPAAVNRASHLVVESTYRDRLHPDADPLDLLDAVVTRTARWGGSIVIPSFAVGRAQFVLLPLHRLKESGRIRDLPVFLDSPMAVEAIAGMSFPRILVSASGIATGGRVLHRLEALAPDPYDAVLFAGFQAAGTRGAATPARAKSVEIHGEHVPVRAEVVSLDSVSGPADSREILAMLGPSYRGPDHRGAALDGLSRGRRTMTPGSRTAGWIRREARLLCSVLLPFLVASAVRAQDPPTTPEQAVAVATASPARSGPTDPSEIEAFFDGLLGALLTEEHVAGATVAIVRDGRLLFSKGYGWADVDAEVPVDPATTLFRIGSVSKLFTWTAVMQLRDEGRIDLDADVNRYLDFRVPDTFAEPITLRHLMTHTPGFEDRSFRLFAPDEPMARGEWLRRNVPARVRPPGQDVAYSNYGSALAGYIVERVSGMSWEEYVERHILEPLGMRSATSRQPLPEPLAPFASRGYVHRDGRFAAQPFDWIAPPLAPAGAVSASAEAMGHFMIAHLRPAAPNSAPLLSDSALERMHSRSFGPDPRLNGWALGFYERSSHGLRIIGHGGGTQRFFSDLSLVPAERLGIFVSFNSPGRDHLLTRRFLEAILDHYYPVAPLSRAEPAPGWSSRAQRFSGSYLPLRRSYTTLETVVAATQAIEVAPSGPGELVLRFPERTERVREVAPAYFETPNRSFAVAFGEGAGGRGRLYLGVGSVTAERVSVWQSPGLHLALFAVALLLFGSVLLLAPARFVLQRQGAGFPPVRGAERWLRWAAEAFALLSLAFVVSIAMLFADPDGYTTGAVEPVLRRTLLLPLLSIPVAAVVVAGAILAFRRRYWTWWGRMHYALVAAAAVAFLLQLQYWNLLGSRL